MAAIGVVAPSCAGDGENDGILVLAAASLTDALVEVAELYESDTGRVVTFSFGGSTALARQVEFGAPADAVVFAGSTPMDRLHDAGRLSSGSRFDLLSNRLVIIGDGEAVSLGGLEELTDESGRIALADPSLAPAGRYAKQALETAGVWEEIEARVIPTLDVRASVGAVDSGGARYGIVYATDAAASPGVSVVYQVPEQLHDLIVYPAAALNGSDAGNGSAFLEFLKSEASLGVFNSHGFNAANQ